MPHVCINCGFAVGVSNPGTFISCTFPNGFVPDRMCIERDKMLPDAAASLTFDSMAPHADGTNGAVRLAHAATALRNKFANIF